MSRADGGSVAEGKAQPVSPPWTAALWSQLECLFLMIIEEIMDMESKSCINTEKKHTVTKMTSGCTVYEIQLSKSLDTNLMPSAAQSRTFNFIKHFEGDPKDTEAGDLQ